MTLWLLRSGSKAALWHSLVACLLRLHINSSAVPWKLHSVSTTAPKGLRVGSTATPPGSMATPQRLRGSSKVVPWRFCSVLSGSTASLQWFQVDTAAQRLLPDGSGVAPWGNCGGSVEAIWGLLFRCLGASWRFHCVYAAVLQRWFRVGSAAVP